MKTLVIIGAGFSGVSTAAHILRGDCTNIQIILINSTRTMARGLAYGTNSPIHLLNTTAGKMSALDDDPDDFLRFCRDLKHPVEHTSYVSRNLYGNYLNSALERAELSNPSVQLSRVVAQVTHIRPYGEGARLKLSDGTILKADHVILAFGNFPPSDCLNLKHNLKSEIYTNDPWNSPARLSSNPDAAVLLIGTGLTAVDMALKLVHEGHSGPIHLLSRRGLLPLGHLPTAIGPFPNPARLRGGSPRQLMAALRELVREHQRQGGDWRAVVDSLRPAVQKLWAAMDTKQQRQFIRHVQPWWDLHRHRLAPTTYERFRHHVGTKQFSIHAGRLTNVTIQGKNVVVDFRRRKDQAMDSIQVSRIINCTGPNLNIQRINAPLIRSLLTQGLVSASPCNVGILVDEQLRVLDQHQQPLSWLSYLGPMLKAQYWEATAVPELRRFSFILASRVAALLTDIPNNNEFIPNLSGTAQ
ncbi:FAD/NAD(P)-binding protein [Pseudomonas rhizoryzae]|uniref:FAD/NAD(P)-binding protein n=1 Tax=Pseudomonas rhizoryzae TaxID=2571129 RepID=UPI0009C04937|nr:FAD/NAD(P)-binding protein [Pseudomonas rhizoryzae]